MILVNYVFEKINIYMNNYFNDTDLDKTIFKGIT